MLTRLDRRICGTCLHWEGERRPDRNKGGFSRLFLGVEPGLCSCRYWKYFHQLRYREQCCIQYEPLELESQPEKEG